MIRRSRRRRLEVANAHAAIDGNYMSKSSFHVMDCQELWGTVRALKREPDGACHTANRCTELKMCLITTSGGID